MNDLLYEKKGPIALLTLNREQKFNAFDDQLIGELQAQYKDAINDASIRVILLKANGKHFSAGADLNWMQRMANYSIEENIQDAMALSGLMSVIYHCPKPTIAMVQGSAYGGGAGLVAACDIAIGADNAHFCFSEVKLGLIPAVISPFVIKAIGPKTAKALFMSAEVIDAQRALSLNLIHHCVAQKQLEQFTMDYAQSIAENAPQAVMDVKQLVNKVADKTINEELLNCTAKLIAEKRISVEGQKGLNAFLHKQKINWN